MGTSPCGSPICMPILQMWMNHLVSIHILASGLNYIRVDKMETPKRHLLGVVRMALHVVALNVIWLDPNKVNIWNTTNTLSTTACSFQATPLLQAIEDHKHCSRIKDTHKSPLEALLQAAFPRFPHHVTRVFPLAYLLVDWFASCGSTVAHFHRLGGKT